MSWHSASIRATFKMPLLSDADSPLPPLCSASRLLRAEIQERLDQKLIPRIGPAVSGHFWELVKKLDSMLRDIPFASHQRGLEAGEQREGLLRTMQAIMHDMSAFNEYLGAVLAVALAQIGKKNKAANHAKDKLEALVNRNFKVPINLVKHSSFRLHWLECFTEAEMTTGFVVGGIVEPKLHGPASHSAPVAEGYSFAFILREVLPTFFQLCAVAEEALRQAQLFDPVGKDLEPGKRAFDTALLGRVLSRLAALPIRGFPNEAGVRVPQLVLQGTALAYGPQPRLLAFKHEFRVSYEVPALQGQSYRIPYWATDATA